MTPLATLTLTLLGVLATLALPTPRRPDDDPHL